MIITLLNNFNLSSISMRLFVFLVFGVLGSKSPIYAESKVAEASIKSPDGNYEMQVYQEKVSSSKKQLYYNLFYKGKQVIVRSKLGVLVENNLFESALAIENDPSELWFDNLDYKVSTFRSHNETWKPLYGERSTIKDRYNELVMHFEKFGNAGEYAEEGHAETVYDRRRNYELNLIVRVYDEGVAFRYHFPENSNGLFMHIVGEQTEFAFSEGTLAYFESWAQGPYHLLPLKDWPGKSERPLTLKLMNGLTVALTEAEMVDYARTKFQLSEVEPNMLKTSMYSAVDAITPFSTPWRVIMAGESPGELLENNDIILNLNPANEISNTSWIKPGKVIRSGLSTAEAKACIDFAAERNLQYVHLDAGWYGPEMKVASDASRVAKDKDLALQEIINYGSTKDIGIIVYVNQRALAKQIDELLPLYQKWGLKGLKFGFVQIGSNRWTNWLHEAVKKASKHRLMVNIHDEYRPTGFSRTYPNLMTQEGIRGNEEMPDATHNTILPFTRYLAGAGDYTICYYDKRIKTTHAHQLAMSVVSYSPLQYLYWYDNPAHYQGEEEIEFFDKVKTVWDDTKVISGEIGEHIAIARRSGEEWFVGIITNNNAREYQLPIEFLEKGRKYVVSIYTDDKTLNTRTQVKVNKFIVDADSIINFSLAKSGGSAVHLAPATDVDVKILKKIPKRKF